MTDPAQRLTLAENFRTVFDAPGEADLINPILLSAYLKTNRADDAFALAAKAADSLPNPVPILTALSFAGYTQAQQQNIKYLPQSIQYAGRAIELLESDKKPANLDAATWGTYKTTLLPSLSQLHVGRVMQMLTEQVGNGSAEVPQTVTWSMVEDMRRAGFTISTIAFGADSSSRHEGLSSISQAIPATVRTSLRSGANFPASISHFCQSGLTNHDHIRARIIWTQRRRFARIWTLDRVAASGCISALSS